MVICLATATTACGKKKAEKVECPDRATIIDEGTACGNDTACLKKTMKKYEHCMQ